MRNKILILLVVLSASFLAKAQVKGVKIGYIDMEYILQNVPEYTEAKNQLEIKAQKWKQEIEVKKNEVTKRKESLKTEQVLEAWLDPENQEGQDNSTTANAPSSESNSVSNVNKVDDVSAAFDELF